MEYIDSDGCIWRVDITREGCKVRTHVQVIDTDTRIEHVTLSCGADPAAMRHRVMRSDRDVPRRPLRKV